MKRQMLLWNFNEDEIVSWQASRNTRRLRGYLAARRADKGKYVPAWPPEQARTGGNSPRRASPSSESFSVEPVVSGMIEQIKEK